MIYCLDSPFFFYLKGITWFNYLGGNLVLGSLLVNIFCLWKVFIKFSQDPYEFFFFGLSSLLTVSWWLYITFLNKRCILIAGLNSLGEIDNQPLICGSETETVGVRIVCLVFVALPLLAGLPAQHCLFTHSSQYTHSH